MPRWHTPDSNPRRYGVYPVLFAGATSAILVIIILISGCGEEPVGSSQTTGDLRFGVIFSSPQSKTGNYPQAPQKVTVDSLSITVSATDIDPIEKSFPVSDGTVSGSIDGIPAGENRIITALAWHQDEIALDLWTGADTVAIEAGTTTEVVFTLNRIQDAIRAVLHLSPESTYVDSGIVADAGGTVDLYSPHDELEYRFLVDESEIRPWSEDPTVIFTLDVKGISPIRVEVRNQDGDSGSASGDVYIRNRPPQTPTDLSPSGLALLTLVPVLSWDCSDDDDDSLTYVIRYDPDSLAVLEDLDGIGYVETQLDSVAIGPIEAGIVYYWEVTADDGMDEAVSLIRSFSTVSRIFSVDSAELSFPCSVTQQTVKLENLIGGSLEWSAWSDDERISIVPASGQLGRSPVNVHVSVESRSGWEPGVVSGSLIFESRGFTEDVAYRIHIDPSLSTALPDSLELTAPVFSDTIGIYITACGDMAWNGTVMGGAWLSINPATGMVPESGAEIVHVTADTTALEPGMNAGTINFEFHDGSIEVSVIAEGLENSGLTIDPDTVHLGVPDFISAVDLTNTGYGLLQWTAGWDETWLTIDPFAGTLESGQSRDIQIAADPFQLPSGATNTVVVFTSGAENESLAIHVQVPGIPVLQISPRQIHIHADSDTASFIIMNNGTGRLGWTAGSDVDWMSIEPETGLLPGGEQESVAIGVNRMDLVPGFYESDIQVNSNGGNITLPITTDVGASGCVDPIFHETFNDGDAFGWVAVPLAGTWFVQNGRYSVMDIPPSLSAWSQYTLSFQDEISVQTDVRFTGGDTAGDERIAGICIRLQEGETVTIDNVECSRLGSVIDPSGIVRFVASDIEGNWFPFGQEAIASLFFETWWNSIGFTMDQTGITAMVNGVEEIHLNSIQMISGFDAVGLTARGSETIRFDRIFICQLP